MSGFGRIVSAVLPVLVLATAGQAGVIIHVDADNCPGPGVGSVGDPYCSIQTAIDNAVDTDEIVVAPGTYFERIDFIGKSITLRSSDGPDMAIIDAQQMGTVVSCRSGEGPGTVLEGFTITGGTGTDLPDDDPDLGLVGGGMLNTGSSPTVVNCTFVGNTAGDYGGGMYNNFSDPTVANCTFDGNTAYRAAGMLNIYTSNPMVIGCTFIGNSAADYGGAMFNFINSDATVINCLFSGNTADRGGGMYNLFADPTVTDCIFSGNSAEGLGGGMAGAFSSPTVSDSTFSGCTAEWGGGMANSDYYCSPTITNCTFTGNTAVSAGGGMNSSGGCSPTVIDCTFSGNTAISGGGMSSDESLTLVDCTFDRNEAGRGGGLYCVAGSPMLIRCTFDRNAAEYRGGGLYSGGQFGHGNPTLVDCTFTGNTAGTDGGGMHNQSNFGPTVTSCTFIGNTAEDGGGINNKSSSGSKFVNCTFSGNSASRGGGMASNFISGTISNCTFVGNSARNGRALAFDSFYQKAPSHLTMTNCILWDGDDEIWNNDDSTIISSYNDVRGGRSGIGNIDADPLFVDPDNGNFRLLAGSPCIDGGNNNAVAALAGTDFDGNPRFADDPDTEDTGCGVPVVVDMGAYEFQGNPGTVVFADLNGDGFVTIADLFALNQCMGSDDPGCCVADLDLDGEVGVLDAMLLLTNLFQSSPDSRQ